MGQWDVYNEILLKLYEKSPAFGELTGNYEAAAEHLCLENLVFSIIREWNNPLNYGKTIAVEKQIWYAIHTNGIRLIAGLPEEYKEKPYDYYLKLKQDATDAEANFKELINKASKSTIRTSHWTRWIFIVTAVMAGATLALAIYPLIQRSDASKAIQRIQDRLEQLEQRTLPHTQTTPPPPLVKPQMKSGTLSVIDSAKK